MMWIVENPDLNAVGCVSRTKPDGSRDEMQVDGQQFLVLTEEELNAWRLSPGFVALERAGRITVYETDKMPKGKPEIPPGKKPTSQYDHDVARQIAFADDQGLQLARIDLWKAEAGSDEDWANSPDVPRGQQVAYLRTRHLQILVAAEFYLTEHVEKRTANQNERLRHIREQIKKIKVLA